MSSHSIFAPSSGAQLIHCAGSVLLQAQFPEDEDSVASMTGTASHWWGAEHLAEDGSRPPVGAVAPNGVTVTQSMADGATQWIEAVEDILAESGTAAVMNVERTVQIPTVHELCYGTPDTDIWVPWSKTLHVVDFKGGRLLHEPKEHVQCIQYAEGRVLELIAADPTLQDQHITVVITIVQPNAYHPLGTVRSWTCNAGDLRAIINKLKAQALLALGPNPPTVTGEGCRYCRARHACTANQRRAYEAVHYVDSATARPLHGAELALELRILEDAMDALKSRLTGLEQQAYVEAREGKVPGYGLESSRGKLDWVQPAADVVALGDAMGVDLRKPLAAITPTQAKKLIDESVIKAYAAHTPGSARLVRTDNLAQQVFGK